MSILGTLPLLCAIAHGQVSEEMLKDEARRFGKAIGSDVDFSKAHVTIPRKGMPSLRVGNTSVNFDYQGKIVGYRCSVSNPSEAKPKITSASEAMNVADSVLRKLSLSKSEFTLTSVELSGRKTKAFFQEVATGPLVTYRQRPHGYPVVGGNSVQIELNRSSGKVVSLFLVNRYTYEEPEVRLSAAEAARKAQSHVLADPMVAKGNWYSRTRAFAKNASNLESKVRLVYVAPGPPSAPSHSTLSNVRMPLCFEFNLPDGSILINARTGALENISLYKTGLHQTRPSDSFPALQVAIGVGLVLVLASAFLSRRLRAPD